MAIDEPATLREISFLDRLNVAGIADLIYDQGLKTQADTLIDAVRCCGEFPECSHVLAWVEKHDKARGHV